MASYSDLHDIGSRLKEFSLVSARAVNGSTAGTTLNGTIMDRRPTSGTFNNLFLSAKVLVPYALSNSTGSTARMIWKMQDSDTTATSAFADFADIDGTTVQTIALSSANVTGVDVSDFRLDVAKRYLRMVTETFDSSTAAIVTYAGAAVFGTGDLPPAV